MRNGSRTKNLLQCSIAIDYPSIAKQTYKIEKKNNQVEKNQNQEKIIWLAGHAGVCMHK